MVARQMAVDLKERDESKKVKHTVINRTQIPEKRGEYINNYMSPTWCRRSLMRCRRAQLPMDFTCPSLRVWIRSRRCGGIPQGENHQQQQSDGRQANRKEFAHKSGANDLHNKNGPTRGVGCRKRNNQHPTTARGTIRIGWTDYTNG